MKLTKELLEEKGLEYDYDFDRYTRMFKGCSGINVYLNRDYLVEVYNGDEFARFHATSLERVNVMLSMLHLKGL